MKKQFGGKCASVNGCNVFSSCHASGPLTSFWPTVALRMKEPLQCGTSSGLTTDFPPLMFCCVEATLSCGPESRLHFLHYFNAFPL